MAEQKILVNEMSDIDFRTYINDNFTELFGDMEANSASIESLMTTKPYCWTGTELPTSEFGDFSNYFVLVDENGDFISLHLKIRITLGVTETDLWVLISNTLSIIPE